MTDHAEPQPPRTGGRLDPLQILFWISVTIGVGAAGVAITAGPSVGQAGAVLLVLLAAAGMVLFFWMSRGAGRRHGAFPERGAIAAADLDLIQITDDPDEVVRLVSSAQAEGGGTATSTRPSTTRTG